MYLWLLDYNCGITTCIKLTKEDIAESEKYESFELFIKDILEDKYDFNLENCCWMTAGSYEYERVGF